MDADTTVDCIRMPPIAPALRLKIGAYSKWRLKIAMPNNFYFSILDSGLVRFDGTGISLRSTADDELCKN
jgi:hypothetical protein